MTPILGTHRPRIRRGFRLQWEAAQSAHVLLYPEGMVKLNRSAGEIMSRCDGALTVEQLVQELERSFACTGLGNDVHAFLSHAVEQRWIDMAE